MVCCDVYHFVSVDGSVSPFGQFLRGRKTLHLRPRENNFLRPFMCKYVDKCRQSEK